MRPQDGREAVRIRIPARGFDPGTATVIEAKRPAARGPWVVTMLHYHPVPLNDLIGRGPMVVHGIKRKSDRRIGDEVALARVPPATAKRRVGLRIILGPKQRGCDGDAYWKVLLDSLVACRALKDDSRHWCETTPVEFERGKAKATILTLEDVG